MIHVENLTKLYSSGKGVKNLTFDIEIGEVFGYLGPNGAGKTTTIRNLLGFLKPDQGSCTISSLDCWSESEKIKQNLGYIPGEIAFFNTMTGIDFLNLMAELYGMKDSKRKNDLIDRFELDPSGKIRKMSKGMKQKLGLITACMHDPEIMIFDEPTAGLDPLMRERFVQFIREEKQRGKTILMSSHSFEEIDRTCDRAGIIKEGVLVDVQTISVLKQTQTKRFRLTLKSEEDLQNLRQTNLNILSAGMNMAEIEVTGSVDHFLKEISKFTVENIDIKATTLEEVFMQYYGREA
jgi:ABC-2 type transport system ATP-binding protein